MPAVRAASGGHIIVRKEQGLFIRKVSPPQDDVFLEPCEEPVQSVPQSPYQTPASFLNEDCLLVPTSGPEQYKYVFHVVTVDGQEQNQSHLGTYSLGITEILT